MGFFIEWGIPILVVGGCLYVAVKLLVFKDLTIIRKPGTKKPKDPAMLCKTIGWATAGFGVATGVEVFFSNMFPLAGMIVVILTFVAYVIIYKKFDNLYG